jgi:hypothetical protein
MFPLLSQGPLFRYVKFALVSMLFWEGNSSGAFLGTRLFKIWTFARDHTLIYQPTGTIRYVDDCVQRQPSSPMGNDQLNLV